MPTDELLSSLEQLRQAGVAQEPNASADNVAVCAFLQTVKRAMRTGGISVKRDFGKASRYTSRGESLKMLHFF
jgi:hypothetical protein